MASGTNKSPRFFVLSMSIFDKVVGIHTYYVLYNYAYLRLVCKCTSNFKCKLSRKNDLAKASLDYRNLTQIESKNKIPKLKLISDPFMNWIYQPFSIEKSEHYTHSFLVPRRLVSKSWKDHKGISFFYFYFNWVIFW